MTQENKISLDLFQLFVQTISSANHLDEMADRLTQLLTGSMGIKGASIFILNPDLEALELVSSAGLSLDYINKGPILVDKSIKIGSNREPVIIPDTATSDLLQYPDKAQQEGVRAIVSYPIVVREKIIGSLRLYHSEQWEVSPNDIRFVEALSQTIGLALLCYRLASAVGNVKDTVNDIHPIWL
ncbi:MAG: GAF domain-containing protein [Desulfosarcinaceae bacterium]|nr:GAF domain-containing protein [Desulfosarcinaceae bacterium]